MIEKALESEQIPLTPEDAPQARADTGGVLHDYLQSKLRLADMIQSALSHVRERGDTLAEIECRELLSRLAADRFNLAVVGQFNRGKSTLMNAILGVDRLPAGVLPLTSVITSVCYGERERALLHTTGQALPIEIPIARLREYVTEDGNPGNRLGIRVAELQLPLEVLRLGFHFVDTPGVGSASAGNTHTTRAFLPEVDAAVFVTSFESPMGESELHLLTEVLDHVRKVFVVINKSDLVPAAERDAIVAYVRGRLPERLQAGRAGVFPVSALCALRGKLADDARGVEESGILELEKALEKLLRTEKAREFLLRMTDRADQLVRQQEALLVLSDHVRSAPEQRAGLAARLDRRRNALRQELQLTMEQVRMHGVAAVRTRLEPRVDSLVVDLTERLTQEVRAVLAGISPEELLGQSDRLSSRVAAQCENAVTGWLAESNQLAGSTLAVALQRAESAVTRILAQTTGLAEEFPESARATLPTAAAPWLPPAPCPIPLPVSPALEWQPDWVLFLWLIPAGPVRRSVLNHLARRLRASVLVLANRILAAMDQAVEESVDRIRRDLVARVDAAMERISRALQSGGVDGDLARIRSLRHRLEAFRAEAGSMRLHVQPLAPADEPQIDVRGQCLICRRVATALFDYMSARQLQLSVNESQRQQHADTLGFCPDHTWYYEALASPQGICHSYPPLLDSLSRRLRALAGSGSSTTNLTEAVAELLSSPVRCPACQLIAAVQRAAAQEVMRSLPRIGSGKEAPAPPLCLPHLHAVLAANPREEQARRLLLIQARAFQRIAEDMRSYALKHEGIRRELATPEEYRSHKTALRWLVGQNQGARTG